MRIGKGLNRLYSARNEYDCRCRIWEILDIDTEGSTMCLGIIPEGTEDVNGPKDAIIYATRVSE